MATRHSTHTSRTTRSSRPMPGPERPPDQDDIMAEKKKGHHRRQKGRRRWIKGWMREWPFIAFVIAILVMLLVLIVAYMWDFGSGPSSNHNNGGHYEPPRALIVMDKTNLDENGTVTFSGTASRGNIVQYLWDFGDGGEGNGPTVPHTYVRYGRFTVRLTVIDVKGAGQTNTGWVHVHHHEEVAGTVSMGQTKDYVLPVGEYCMGAKVSLSYPTGQMINGKPSNIVDIELYYPNGTLYRDSKDQKTQTGSTQTKELHISNQEMAASFYKDWKVKVDSSSGINVRYELVLDVYY